MTKLCCSICRTDFTVRNLVGRPKGQSVYCSPECSRKGLTKITVERGRRVGQNRVFRFGISQERFEKLLAEQNYRCALCDAPDTGVDRWWHIDHDHSCCPGKKTCGKCVRGILCRNCNIMLGHAKDNPVILDKAARYLRKERAHAAFINALVED